MTAVRRSCFIIGEGSLVIQCGETWLSQGHEIRGVVTNEVAIQRWADKHSIPFIRYKKADLAGFMSSSPFDYLFSVVNLRMLPSQVIELPTELAINFHDGPLPKYAGINATSWALMNGEGTHGVTWHEMKAEADTGRLAKQKVIEISEGETAFSLNAKCFTAGIESFRELVDDITHHRLELTEQNFDDRTYFGMYQRPERACVIDFAQSSASVSAFVRSLDFGTYENPLGWPKLLTPQGPIACTSVEEASGKGSPGEVLSIADDQLVVATKDGAVSLGGLKTLAGEPVGEEDLAAEYKLVAGVSVALSDDALGEKLTAAYSASAKAEKHWVKRFAEYSPLQLPIAASGVSDVERVGTVTAPQLGDRSTDELVAALGVFLARVSGERSFDVGYSDDTLFEQASGAEAFFASYVPLNVVLADDASVADGLGSVRRSLDKARGKGPYSRDILGRHPELESLPKFEHRPVFPIVVRTTDAKGSGQMVPGAAMVIEVGDREVTWRYRESVFAPVEVERLGAQFTAATGAMGEDPRTPVRELSLLSDAERDLIVNEWNATDKAVEGERCVHRLISDQARKTPDAEAVAFQDRVLTFRELDERSNQLANHLRSLGVKNEDVVGVYMARSEELLVATLGIMKAGAAYVPLDPAYPHDRITFMIEDARIPVVITQQQLREKVPGDVRTVALDGDRFEISKSSAAAVDLGGEPEVTGDNLAYVIYTSGSTGKPKGVMVEHYNVVNFFSGMDDVLGFAPGEAPGVWLAVTSLNFDISVLELFWTLSRGFKVVIFGEQGDQSPTLELKNQDTPIEFGAFYFSSDEGAQGLANKYDLLIKGVKFADNNGFSSVWTPERHFHAFGGLFPNPAVTSAALATITKNVRLMAGSCVSPLHHPARVAEDWSVVDNLSNGRVGLSFAAGWQPNDFVLRPENFADRKGQMFRDIETVRKLWRGEAVTFKDGSGKDVAVKTLPRPYQKELPAWVTIAGNPETFAGAGKAGTNVLTHLLGQSFEEVAQKIAAYRTAYTEAGHEGRGYVSLMLHTYVAEDDDEAKEIVREPMKAYLKSAVGLVKEAAWSFPTFKKTTTMQDGSFSMDHLSEEDMDALLDHAFERYFETSGLFGSFDRALKIVDSIKAMDVDEIACLIDFGIDSQTVLDGLPMLAKILELTNRKHTVEGGADYSIPALVAQHAVTHFQCTPSMAQMLMIDDATQSALSGLNKVCIGGEAFPVALAQKLSELVSGDVVNMYGPTETTIWSSTQPIKDVGDAVPIGRPIANTDVLILDRNLQLVPPGQLGELCIGGHGVVRGYLHRPELTDERFVQHPLRAKERIYRTGDLARFGPGGILEFHGRLDHQVKLRGYRMELGEIETILGSHPEIREAAVIVREDAPGDKRLVGYFIAKGTAVPGSNELRDHLSHKLPDYMVPQAFVPLDAFPRTPNKKIDRKGFPAPDKVKAKVEAAFVKPESGLEETIAKIWQGVLNLSSVGVHDNFFDLGGHSLLTIQVHQELSAKVDKSLSLVDLFRYPTIATLANYLGTDQPQGEALEKSAARGDARKEAMARRRRMQSRRRS